MNVAHVLLWGFAATLTLSCILILGRGLHWTRIDIPFLLGTMWTSHRQKAIWSGFILHIFFGWFFAFAYAWVFEDTGIHEWWFGMILGFLHATVVLTLGMNLISNFHPRMATEERGPEPTRMLEPPGFMVMNYGKATPLATYIAHVVYGGILGLFY